MYVEINFLMWNQVLWKVDWSRGERLGLPLLCLKQKFSLSRSPSHARARAHKHISTHTHIHTQNQNYNTLVLCNSAQISFVLPVLHVITAEVFLCVISHYPIFVFFLTLPLHRLWQQLHFCDCFVSVCLAGSYVFNGSFPHQVWCFIFCYTPNQHYFAVLHIQIVTYCILTFRNHTHNIAGKPLKFSYCTFNPVTRTYLHVGYA